MNSLIPYGEVISTTNKKKHYHTIHILFDSGASKTLIRKYILMCQTLTKTKHTTKWNVLAGTLKKSEIAAVQLKINELNPTATIICSMHVYSNHMKYAMIIGYDLLHELVIVLSFSDKTVTWNDGIINI